VIVAMLLAGVVGLFGTQGAGEVLAAFPGSDGLIAFTSNRDVAAGEIYTMTPGGTATRVTFSNVSSDPAWSPDGSRIAFISTDYQIFVMNANGSGRKQLTTDSPPKSQPAWSPDGARIAYVSNSSDIDGQTDFEIWTINADGTGRTQLSNNTDPDSQPAWSPLGDRIAFVGTRTGDSDRNVYVMDADGSNEVNITRSSLPGCGARCYQGHDDNPAWSPDGSKIAFIHGRFINGGGLPDIWTMDPNGDGKINITDDDSTSDLEPAWSPDGSRIVYKGIAADNDANIYLMNADGSDRRPIETTVAKDEKADWQPIPVCTMTVNANNDPLVGTVGNDVLCGDGRNNIINGSSGNDIILGRGGNDRLISGFGNDILNGGPGTDTVSYVGSRPVKANLTTAFATGIGLDVLLAVENLTGSSANDRLTGTGRANVLVGGGADALNGLGGPDTLNARDGVSGNDTVNGGSGRDTCRTDATEASVSGCP